MYKEPVNLLRHIADECAFLIAATKGISKDDFLNDEVLKRAVVRSLEIIGEAAKKIPAEVKQRWNAIEWKVMTGMRDRLIHDYMGVNYLIVWDVVENKISGLYTQMLGMIESGEVQ